MHGYFLIFRRSICIDLPIEQQALAADGVVHLTVGVGDLAVDEGGGDGGFEGDAFEGRPTAFVFNVFLRDGVRRLGVDQGEVGPVAFADEAAVQGLENFGGVVRGFFGDGFQG